MNISASAAETNMLNGELYDSLDPILVSKRVVARQLINKFNDSSCNDTKTRSELLQQIFGSVGSSVDIEPPLRVDYGSNIHIGSHVFMNFGCIMLDCNRISIGNHVQFGPNVQLYAATHPLDPELRKTLEYAKPITIGDNVWIGGGAIILPGVVIGDNTTIGAGSVVTKNIPPCVVAAGNPCKVLRQIPSISSTQPAQIL